MKNKIQDAAIDPQIRKSIRIWPGVVIALLQWTLWYLVPKLLSGGTAIAISVFGGLLCGLAIVAWWAFFSRAPRSERWTAVPVMIFALVVMPLFTHPSIKTGLSGIMYYVYAVPVLCISFVIWALLSRGFSKKLRYISMIFTILVASGLWILVRSDGISGDASAELTWRWATSDEERLMSQYDEEFVQNAPLTNTRATWPGFRGPNRNGIVHGLKINTDWQTTPPKEMWRRPVGPGCSSFASRGGLLYTQEQLGEDELVACYQLSTGKAVWKHHDKARFWDSHAGAGPRSTPTLHDSLVITLGATGIVNVLDALDGEKLWSRNAATDLDAKLPGWGFAGSPLVVDTVVIVAISGKLIAYNLSNGDSLWVGPDGGENYSSPQLFTIDGVKQVLMMSQVATSSFSTQDGKLLWEYPWEGGAIIQPAITPDCDILISEGYKKGVHRLTVSHTSGNWTTHEHWMSTKIRPDFNDFVIHKGYIYGFEGSSLTCIDLKDGTRKWKEGRYGGQLLLLADQDLLLLISEQGELVLVEAKAEQLTELASFKAIEGKTWNHPIIVDNILMVRNTSEMAAFSLALAEF